MEDAIPEKQQMKQNLAYAKHLYRIPKYLGTKL